MIKDEGLRMQCEGHKVRVDFYYINIKIRTIF